MKCRGCKLHVGGEDSEAQRVRASRWWKGKLSTEGAEFTFGEDEHEVQRVHASLWWKGSGAQRVQI